MTRIFYDTEFIEDGHTLDLISIGMVRESDGAELYLVSSEFSFSALARNSWLMNNVAPSLPLKPFTDGGPWDHDHPDIKHVASRVSIAHQVRRFIQDTLNAELWAWYGAYDHVALAQLFGRMIDLPTGIPMWTNDLRQECQRLGNPQMPEQPAGVHNALADARHNLVRAQFLDAVSTPDRR